MSQPALVNLRHGAPPPPFVHRVRVSYAICTVGNHVYHSRFLDLLEEARGEFMRARGQPFLAWQNRGWVFPIVETCLRYLRLARYDDELAIEVRLTALRGVRLNFAYVVRNAAGQVVVEAETRHACAGLDERPRRLPPELMGALHEWVAPDPTTEGP
jgi:acyl-CoA thioester hydrolase